MIRPQIILYHGTNKKSANSITKNGFKDRTFFARDLADAIGYGGKYVFGVCFYKDELPDYWEVVSEYIPTNRIVFLTKYGTYKIIDNKKLRTEVFKSNDA